jgi:hypothetical protein
MRALHTLQHFGKQFCSSVSVTIRIACMHQDLQIPKNYGVFSELGWSEYGKIEFERSPNGPYRLKSGTRLKLVGILDDYLVCHIKIKNEVIEVNGKPVGKTKLHPRFYEEHVYSENPCCAREGHWSYSVSARCVLPSAIRMLRSLILRSCRCR